MNSLPLKTSLAAQKTSGGVLVTRLRFSKIPAPPAAPADVILLEDPGAPPRQTLHRLVARQGHELTFETEGEKPALEKGVIYGFRAWWTPDQLAAAQRPRGVWRRQDLRTLSLDQGWDHEHCALCWRKLSPLAGFAHVGYTDGDNWLCEICCTRFIASGLGPRLGEKI